MYSDNNTDSKKGSYDHLIYDFFDFDIGKPIRGTDRVMQGVGLKEHERGFIAYNITQQNRVVERKNGSKISIPAYSGYFCEEISERKCLPLD